MRGVASAQFGQEPLDLVGVAGTPCLQEAEREPYTAFVDYPFEGQRCTDDDKLGEMWSEPSQHR